MVDASTEILRRVHLLASEMLNEGHGLDQVAGGMMVIGAKIICDNSSVEDAAKAVHEFADHMTAPRH